MTQMRIALAQVNPCAGDVAGNSSMVLEWTSKAVRDGAHVVAFPETVLAGYPTEGLALRKSFAAANRAEVDALALRLQEAGCGDTLVIVGHLDRDDEGIRNSASFLYGGEVAATYDKHHLPNYGIFDEARYFAPGYDLPIMRLHGLDIGVVICEDLWQNGGPVAALGQVGVDLIVCVNGSPYERAKDDQRSPLVLRRSEESAAPIAYVNMVGAQDELVFDGDSMVGTPQGAMLAHAPRFVENLMVLDLDLTPGGYTTTTIPSWLRLPAFDVTRHVLSPDPLPRYEPLPAPHEPERLSDLAEVWSALVTGVGDYVHKNRFRSVTFGFSGGIDSALCAVLCADAVGADAVYGVSMPSEYSSEHSRSDAAELARRINCHYEVRPIGDMVDIFVRELGLSGLAEENVQARCRGVTLMALSNQHGHLVLAPGNKTELAVGYSTIYGDAVGGFAPIKDVPKTLVWKLAQWRNSESEKRGEVPPIPESSISKPPSAELRPNQVDTDSLPAYEILDAILGGYVEGNRGYAELTADGFNTELVERVLQMVDRAEHKRRQYPPGTKITLTAFGRDGRLPVTNRWREARP